MTIRDATGADLAAILEIYNASIPGRSATADTYPVSGLPRVAELDCVARDLIVVARRLDDARC